MVLARPADGQAVVLDPTSSVIWVMLADWCSLGELEQKVAVVYPRIAADERRAGLTEVLQLLDAEGLLERGTV